MGKIQKQKNKRFKKLREKNFRKIFFLKNGELTKSEKNITNITEILEK